MQNHLKDEIHNILSGKSEVSYGRIIQAAAGYLRDGEKAGGDAETDKHFKRQEAERLKYFISENNLWLNNINFSQYLSEGAEQKVYLKDDHVFKLNDAIYYNSWKEYFHNLLLHNYFFPDTAYELIGFTTDGETLYAVVRQNYILSARKTDLNNVGVFMKANGFENTRNNDYYHPELRLILEDLHDENVLTSRNGNLYFIDTVFYLTEDFWKKTDH